MKTLYLDIFSGISGDMFIGALLDLGLDIHRLEEALAKIDLHDYHVHAGRAKRCEIEGVKFDVHLGHHHEHGAEHEHKQQEPAHEHHEHDHDHKHDHGHGHSHGHESEHEHHEHLHEHAGEHGHGHGREHEQHEHGRDYASIKRLITGSALSPWVKGKAIAIFDRIAAAEGKIHGVAPERVHFHEVGAVDSIVDIVGACIGLEILGKPRVLAGTAVDGTGWINCAHGRFPIPAPATLEILAARGVSISQCEEPHELITPTGAALLAELAESFGPMQSLTPERIGFGVGGRENKTRPNVLRAVLGQSEAASRVEHDWETDHVEVLETNLDDLSPEILGNFVETALAAGALDVFYTPIQMKKNRPGVLLSVLCAAADADKFSEMILRQTSAFGVRSVAAQRRKLRRRFEAVQTRHGEVTVKLALLDGRVVQVAPEYESCRKIADEKKVPLAEVYRGAMISWKG